MTLAPAHDPALPGSSASDPLVVDTTLGRVRGTRAPGSPTRIWRGIPYAAPPVGARRFAAPTPHPGWAGVRDATANGATAVQPGEWRPEWLKPILGARRSRGEDCLTLNIWSPPATSGSSSTSDAHAVVVWIHGGSFNTGSGGLFDAARLVELGDVVLVTVNYRLGGLGFIDFGDALGGDERFASNAGVRDQLAALTWVRDNIAAFGGDPARVTLAGESAGACTSTLLMAAPVARGLVHGVIAQSGALTLASAREDAERAGLEVLAELGISRERSNELWRRPASAILGATMRAQARRTGSLVTRPWWDDDLLPASLSGAYASLAPVPLLLGTNLHEHRAFVKTKADVMPLARPALASVLTESFGWPEAAKILHEYPDTADGNTDLGSDLVFHMPTVHLAEVHSAAAPVWKYRFDYGSGLLGFGAFHSIELNFLFPTPANIAAPLFLGPRKEATARRELGNRFRTAWLNFVRTGTPGDDTWPTYDATTPEGGRANRIWNVRDGLACDPHAPRRLAWAGRDATVH